MGSNRDMGSNRNEEMVLEKEEKLAIEKMQAEAKHDADTTAFIVKFEAAKKAYNEARKINDEAAAKAKAQEALNAAQQLKFSADIISRWNERSGNTLSSSYTDTSQISAPVKTTVLHEDNDVKVEALSNEDKLKIKEISECLKNINLENQAVAVNRITFKSSAGNSEFYSAHTQNTQDGVTYNTIQIMPVPPGQPITEEMQINIYAKELEAKIRSGVMTMPYVGGKENDTKGVVEKAIQKVNEKLDKEKVDKNGKPFMKLEHKTSDDFRKACQQMAANQGPTIVKDMPPTLTPGPR